MMGSRHRTPIEGIAIVVSDARSGDLPGSRCSMRSISTPLDLVMSCLDSACIRCMVAKFVDARHATATSPQKQQLVFLPITQINVARYRLRSRQSAKILVDGMGPERVFSPRKLADCPAMSFPTIAAGNTSAWGMDQESCSHFVWPRGGKV